MEELWQTRRHDDFYHGLIQVAALMHQLKRGKVRGARKLATTAIGYLAPFSPEKKGVNVAEVLRRLKKRYLKLRGSSILPMWKPWTPLSVHCPVHPLNLWRNI